MGGGWAKACHATQYSVFTESFVCRPYVHDVKKGARDVTDDEQRDDGQQGDARLLCHLPAQQSP